MPNLSKKDKTLEELIMEINVVLDEIKKEQINVKKMTEQNHKVNMQKLLSTTRFAI